MNKVIDELQTRITFQEDMIEKLNQRVIEQQNELDELQIKLKHLNEKIRSMDQHGNGHERPPHY